MEFTVIPSFIEFKLTETPTTLQIDVGQKELARAIAHTQRNEIAAWCRELKKKDAWITYGSGKKFRVLATTGLSGGIPELRTQPPSRPNYFLNMDVIEVVNNTKFLNACYR